MKSGCELSEFTRTVISAVRKIGSNGQTATFASICNHFEAEYSMSRARIHLPLLVRKSLNRAVARGQLRKEQGAYVLVNSANKAMRKCSDLLQSPRSHSSELLLDKLLAEKVISCVVCLIEFQYFCRTFVYRFVLAYRSCSMSTV